MSILQIKASIKMIMLLHKLGIITDATMAEVKNHLVDELINAMPTTKI